MDKLSVIERIGNERVVPVVRTGSSAEAERICEAVISGGLGSLEITMTVPDAASLIRQLTGDQPQALIGAGTVLDAEKARECVDAGAAFIVSPALDESVVKFCNEAGVAVIPGAMTPTEVYRAHSQGADAVKVFPVSSLGGTKYLSSIKAVFPGIKIMTTGGIGVDQAAEYIEAGAFAVGIGDRLTSGSSESIREACVTLAANLAFVRR